ncbi:MAG TPA: hypothetical protein PLJ65_12700, partial [Casimicrobium sp.]|nr:hypothetical protein [Casimicrobium sp.]
RRSDKAPDAVGDDLASLGGATVTGWVRVPRPSNDCLNTFHALSTARRRLQALFRIVDYL